MPGIETVVDLLKAIVPLAAFAVALLVAILAISQWRDVRRLRAWHAADPEYPQTNLKASEVMLDRAETELEVLLAEPADVAEVAAAIEHVHPPTAEHLAELPSATGEYPITAAHRVTSERPALERLTMERVALDPHPRWHRWKARLARPRLLIVLGLVMVVVAGVAVVGADRLTTIGGSGDETPSTSPDGVPAAEFSVVVLNGATGFNDVTGDVVERLDEAGIPVTGDPGNAANDIAQSVVMFSQGNRTAAIRVAGALGIEAIQPIDRPTERRSNGADVVVVVGQNMAR